MTQLMIRADVQDRCKKLGFLSFFFIFSCLTSISHAEARTGHTTHSKNNGHTSNKRVAKASVHKISSHSQSKKLRNGNKNVRYRSAANYNHRYSGGNVIQCVAFARSASDVALSGNAVAWWDNASGVYDRGQAPENGSVLSFRSTRRMPLGHVAVVRRVVDSRTIIIDQSHWAQRGISRNVPVIDVSPNNDWTAVRVALNGNNESFGSIYPTNGFIYPRAAGAQENPMPNRRIAPQQRVKVWTADAATSTRPQAYNTEVALAPNVSDNNIFADAPNRTLK